MAGGTGLRMIGAAVLLVIGDGQAQAPAAAERDDAFRIAVQVDLVVLHATVRDRTGQYIAGLRQEDVAVYEDGVRQSIRLFVHEDVPVTVGLVVDHSGSMSRKLGDVIAGARAFAKVSNPSDEMFVVNFNEMVSLGLPPGMRFTNQPHVIERALSNLPTSGKTALYDAIDAGLTGLGAGSRDKKVLIVISDGGDNASSRTLEGVLLAAEQLNAIIYTVGVFAEDDPDRNTGVLRRLAKTTGGESYFPDRIEDVVSIGEQIAKDIRHQYTIGYLSASTSPPGEYRRVRVEAKGGKGKLAVRTRAGYVDGGPK